jgi:hypothetical protein
MTPYLADIRAAAAAHAIDPLTFEALVVVESAGYADAFRYEAGILSQLQTGTLKIAGALPEPPIGRRLAASYGLTQILYVTACDYGFTGEPELLFVPATSLEYGARHLAALLAWAGGDESRALAAYNGGKKGNVRPPLRNHAYVDRVLRARAGLRGA